MQETGRNILVGVFMITGLAVLGVLMIMFGEQPSWLGGHEYELRIEFSELDGVSEGMPVSLNGVQVGRVGRLEFVDKQNPSQGVKVIALIKEAYFIPSGATARVQPGLMGISRGRILIVTLGVETAPMDRDRAVIQGVMGSAFGDLIPETMLTSLEKSAQQIGNLAEAATPVAGDLHGFFEMRSIEQVDDPLSQAQGITANIYTVAQRLDKTLRHINEVLGDAETQSALKHSIQNFERMTVDGREAFAVLRRTSTMLETDLATLADRLEAGLSDANTGINEIRARLVPALDVMAQVLTDLSKVSRDLAEGEGTAGLFLRDARLYETMVLGMKRMTDAIDTMRRILDRFEQQGYIEFKAHSAIGPMPVRSKREIPPPR
ncbi:MAG: MlaD family protein [Phycisphaerae bacterium]